MKFYMSKYPRVTSWSIIGRIPFISRRKQDKFYEWFSKKFPNVLSKKDKVVIHNYDVWNMDYTLALIILPMLKLLKKNKNGSPYTDDEDVPDHLKSTAAPPKENEWDIDDFHHLRWEWVLDEMIWVFDQIVKDADCESDEFKIIGKGKYDEEALRAYREHQQKALILFGKYYRGLWD